MMCDSSPPRCKEFSDRDHHAEKGKAVKKAQSEKDIPVSQTPMLLQAHVLTVGYDDRVVLREVDFQIHSGEFWFFLGQNGGGKSTLLRAILGLLPLLSGTLWLHPELASRERTGF